ncbi:MAG: DUF6261 family protein [Tannerellaceae bacterium]|jgi:hypothetical protein|nr:DUF6261 family protein [Tannerellaceae bacterium]
MELIKEKIKEINRPSFRLVRNAGHYAYHGSVLKAISPVIAKEYKMEDLRLAYERLFRKEEEAFMRHRSFEETKDIQAADQKRDELFCFIKRFIENMKYNPDPELKAGAEVLNRALALYRNAHRKSFEENTDMVDRFIAEIEKEEYAGALNRLDLQKSLSLLKEANTKFAALYHERLDKKRQRSSEEKMKQLRPLVDQAFFEVIKFINAIYLVSHEITKEEQVIDELGRIIDEINGCSEKLSVTKNPVLVT